MKRLASTLATFIIYAYVGVLISLFCKLVLHIQLMQGNMEHVYWVNVAADLILLVTSIALNYRVLITNKFDGNSFGHKLLKFVVRLILLFLAFMAIKVFVAVIITIVAELLHLSAQSNNQAAIEQMIKVHPIGMFVSVAFFAPFFEELIFRGAMRKIITNDTLFVISSGLLFGLVHVMNSRIAIIVLLLTAFFINIIITSEVSKKKKLLSSLLIIVIMLIVFGLSIQLTTGNILTIFNNFSLSEAISSISYITMGLCLAYIYKRYNNIYLNMGIHSLNNIFGFVVLVFTLN